MKGIININKPADFTSHDVIAVMRRLTGVKKIGHTGTLDPMATGVLPVCIGQATRVIQYMENDEKEYRCQVRFGVITDTYDIWGEVLEEASKERIAAVTEDRVRKALESFRGEIEQYPPAYSAIKVNGRKLYEYARAGQEVEIKPRKVTIFSLEMTDFTESGEAGLPEATFLVHCSKGTYIRSLCYDLGRMLETGAAMSGLVRTKAGVFDVKDAVDLVALRESEHAKEDIEQALKPMDYCLTGFPMISLTDAQTNDLIDGKEVTVNDFFEKNSIVFKESEEVMQQYRVYREDCFIGLAHQTGAREIRPTKIFCTEKR